MTEYPTPFWALDGAINTSGLEQFATSVAALSQGSAAPLEVLEQVLHTIVENLNSLGPSVPYSIDRLLEERAAAYGFESVREFRLSLLKLIGERMVDLECSRLTAQQRQMRRREAEV